MTTKETIGNFTVHYSKPITITLEKQQKHARMSEKKGNDSGAQHEYFQIFFQIKISYLALEHRKG